MSDRYYSDIDEDDYFNEPDFTANEFEAQNETQTEDKETIPNPRKYVREALYKDDYVKEIKGHVPKIIEESSGEDTTKDTTFNKKTYKKMQVENDGTIYDKDKDGDYDRRLTRRPVQKSVNEQIIDEETQVKARLEKVIQKRQEKVQLLERRMNVMSVYENVRFFVRMLYTRNVKLLSNTYFFTDDALSYLEIISSFNVGTYIDDFKTISIEEKLDTILTLMAQSKSKEIFNKYSHTQIFLVLLNLFGVKHYMNCYIVLEGVELRKRFRLKFGRNKPNEKQKKGSKKKRVMSSIDVQISTIVSNIVNELNENNMHLQIHDGVHVYNYHKFNENSKARIQNSIAGKFFFGVLRIEKQHQIDQLVISNVSVLELDEEIWVQTLMNIYNIGLKKTVDDITSNNDYLSIMNQKLIMAMRKSRIPQSNYEFRINEFYTIKSVLKRGEMLKDDAQPTGFTFMDQPVYPKSDVIELYGKVKWKMKGRQVKTGENPIKIMPNIYKTDQLMELYAEWQTEPHVIEVKDGKLPENEFGNIEMFGAPLPKELVHLNYKGIWRACKELGVDYKHAVTGFDIRKGRTFAVKSGIVIFKVDEEEVMNRWEIIEKEMDKKEHSKRIENSIKKWKMIFKSYLVKKYMSNNY